ncbi:SGNH/GDSL hydrolase family protein [Tengunoibacter tsumagoiensis]|uniref:SGNH hydrolase-type esterase domain-containing protein n=1 Tax=Tengunoibacter tsumagoiensis TaxID=2014871 RepID=A0A401ZV55_9CHLR|nr:SGNH/GDSL hydrolase family protein [Tengunoibacter tsumagoiensis]GCE10604.1 hypothetical protein KTT_04630 [Tengunoibacter tsumagoiensis]
MHITNYRCDLTRTKEQLAKGFLTVGFIGTSITDARVQHNWPEPVMRWLILHYPHVQFKIENAAIAATGSELAVFRAKHDLIEKGCDLIFVEYAVNDSENPPGWRMKTRETLLRILLDGQRDVVLVYTYIQNMYSSMAEGRAPDSIAEFEALADHYNINSVWMSLYAFRQVQQGLLRWEEWLPDGLHPTERGSLSYAESVIEFLQQGLNTTNEQLARMGTQLPDPMVAKVWNTIEFVPLRTIKTEGPWLLRNWPSLPWIEELLETSAIGARLVIPFEGQGLALGFDFGFYSAEYYYRLDGKERQYSNRERPYWYPDTGLYLVQTLFDDLPAGKHELEIEVVHGNTEQCKGTHFRLAFAAAIQCYSPKASER